MGRQKNKTFFLFVDSKKPIIHSILPAKNKFTNGDLFYIKYSEDNLKEIKLFWEGVNGSGGKILNCSSGRKQECETSVDLSIYDGKYIEYWLEVSDSVNTVITKKTKVFVDTTSPELNVYKPEEGRTYGRSVPFKISVSENVTIEYKDSWDEIPQWRRLCSNCDSYGIEKQKTKTFRKGIHNLTIKATDKAGNFDEEDVGFFVDY